MLGTLGAAAVVAVDEALERAKGAGGALRGVFGRRAMDGLQWCSAT